VSSQLASGPMVTFSPYHSTVSNPKDPVTQPLNKISKICFECFGAFRCGVCVPNLNSLASKLSEEIEVTDRLLG